MKVFKWALVAGGGLIAAVVLAVAALGGSISQAQTPTDSSGARTAYEQALADQLGVSVDQLEAARQAALNNVLEQAVANGKITEEQAQNIRDHPFAARRGLLRNAAQRLHNAVADVFSAAAKTIGISNDEMKTDLQNGQSLAQIAADHNVSTDALKAGITSEVQSQLDQAVANGTIDQAKADKISAALAQRLDTLIQRSRPNVTSNQ